MKKVLNAQTADAKFRGKRELFILLASKTKIFSDRKLQQKTRKNSNSNNCHFDRLFNRSSLKKEIYHQHFALEVTFKINIGNRFARSRRFAQTLSRVIKWKTGQDRFTLNARVDARLLGDWMSVGQRRRVYSWLVSLEGPAGGKLTPRSLRMSMHILDRWGIVANVAWNWRSKIAQVRKRSLYLNRKRYLHGLRTIGIVTSPWELYSRGGVGSFQRFERSVYGLPHGSNYLLSRCVCAHA